MTQYVTLRLEDAMMISRIMASSAVINVTESAEDSAQTATDSADLATNQAEADSATKPSRAIPWGKEAVGRYGIEFIEGVLWIESQLGLKTENLMACMMFESSLNHTARNPYSSASGLIQFMAATAVNLGTTIGAIRAMDVMTQLSYVYRYFKDFAGRGYDLKQWDIADTYMAILWPAGIGKPLDYNVFVGGSNAYKVNKGLDKNEDGFVTKREAAQRIIDLYDEGLEPDNVLFI